MPWAAALRAIHSLVGRAPTTQSPSRVYKLLHAACVPALPFLGITPRRPMRPLGVLGCTSFPTPRPQPPPASRRDPRRFSPSRAPPRSVCTGAGDGVPPIPMADELRRPLAEAPENKAQLRARMLNSEFSSNGCSMSVTRGFAKDAYSNGQNAVHKTCDDGVVTAFEGTNIQIGWSWYGWVSTWTARPQERL